jgi:hypothetical protein
MLSRRKSEPVHVADRRIDVQLQTMPVTVRAAPVAAAPAMADQQPGPP